MKTYTIGENRVLIVKKNAGSLEVTLKEKNSNKFAIFTPNRWAALLLTSDLIDEKIKELKNNQYVKFQEHLGGGWYVSITTGFWCVDLRKFFVPHGETESRPTKTGLALRLLEWDELKKIVDTIHKAHPILAEAKPCYAGDDHLNQMGAFSCKECYPFLDL